MASQEVLGSMEQVSRGGNPDNFQSWWSGGKLFVRPDTVTVHPCSGEGRSRGGVVILLRESLAASIQRVLAAK